MAAGAAVGLSPTGMAGARLAPRLIQRRGSSSAFAGCGRDKQRCGNTLRATADEQQANAELDLPFESELGTTPLPSRGKLDSSVPLLRPGKHHFCLGGFVYSG